MTATIKATFYWMVIGPLAPEVQHIQRVMDRTENQNAAIVELDCSNIPKVCQLFQNVFGQAVSPESWRWKYHEGPRLNSVNLVAIDADGELIGHAGATVFPGKGRDSPLSMIQVCDVMVLPSARGNLNLSNVYPRLLTVLQQVVATRFTAPFAYGFAGKRQVNLGTRMGFYRALHPYCPIYYTPSLPISWRTHLWQVKAIDWDPARIDKIWAQHQPTLKSPIVLRSGAYLGWRYKNHPSHSYQLWTLRHSLRLRDCGWLVTRTMPNGEVCIVDLLRPNSASYPDLMSALAKEIIKTAPELPPIYGWVEQNPTTPSAQHVIACEVKILDWSTAMPNPTFQPGDTDVY